MNKPNYNSNPKIVITNEPISNFTLSLNAEKDTLTINTSGKELQVTIRTQYFFY